MICDRNYTHFPTQGSGVDWGSEVAIAESTLERATPNHGFDPIARLVEGADQAINLTLA